MKLIRFMSAAEAIRLLNGGRLHNKANHREGEWKSSTSVGFCFAVAGDGLAKQEIYQAARLLSGITTMHVCLIAHIDDDDVAIRFTLTSGKYSSGRVQELSATKYGLDNFTEWAMFAPRDLNPLIPIASVNWVNPRLIAKAQ
jgi:hypothetical protein